MTNNVSTSLHSSSSSSSCIPSSSLTSTMYDRLMSLPCDLFELSIASFLTVKDMCRWTLAAAAAVKNIHQHAIPTSLVDTITNVSAASFHRSSSFFAFNRLLQLSVRTIMQRNRKHFAFQRWNANTLEEFQRITLSQSTSSLVIASSDAHFSCRSMLSAKTASNSSALGYFNWHIGTGWRDAYRVWPPLEGKLYYVFEPYWLWVGEEDGILFNGEWFHSASKESTAAMESHHVASDAPHSISTNENTCGAGIAATRPNTRAVILPLQLYSQLAFGAAGVPPHMPLDSTLFPQLMPISQWSPTRLLGFTQAHQSLSAMHRAFLAQHVHAFFNYDPELAATDQGLSQDAPTATQNQRTITDTCTWPVPFLLPWPIERENKNVSRARARWKSTESIPNEMFDEWQWAAETERDAADAASTTAAVPPTTAANDVSDCPFDIASPSIPSDTMCTSHLSGVVRGCPWVLPVNHADELNSIIQMRVEEEMSLIARIVATQLGYFPELRHELERFPSAAVSAAEFRHGVRNFSQLQSTTTTASSSCEYQQEVFDPYEPRLRWFKQCKPVSDSVDSSSSSDSAGSADPQPLPAELASSLSQLLPSSFVISLGAEHLIPFPALIVAPIAPGWVGGFLAGGNTLH